MILWLWLCWGFSTSAGQPDSELMARYLEEKLMADYSIMEQVGFQAVVARERLVAGAGLAPPLNVGVNTQGGLLKLHLLRSCLQRAHGRG